MEFYKEYVDDDKYGLSDSMTAFEALAAVEKLNADVKANPQWKSEVKAYTIYGSCTFILVYWVGLSETPFKENKE